MTTPIGSGTSTGRAHDDTPREIPRPVPTGTGEELLQQVIAMLDEQRSEAHKARSAARQVQTNAARERIGQMREAADFELAAACVKGGATVASSAASGDAGTYTQAGATVAEGTLNWFSSQADADADAASIGEQIAGNAASDAGDFVQEAGQRMDRAISKLDAILQAEVDASRAAIRG